MTATDATETTLDWERLARTAIHPTKLRILEALAAAGEPRSPNQLSNELDEPLGNVSYHVRQLVSQGHLTLDGTAPRRGAVEHFYRTVRVELAGDRP